MTVDYVVAGQLVEVGEQAESVVGLGESYCIEV